MAPTPPTPLPDPIPSFVVPLPIPVKRPRIDDVTELTFLFTKENDRNYSATPPEGGDTQTIWVADYKCTHALGNVSFSVAANAESGKIPEAVGLLALAVARHDALVEAYESQWPDPLPLPDNPGLSSPLFAEAYDPGNGTLRLRGFCSGLHYLKSSYYQTVDVYVAKVFP